MKVQSLHLNLEKVGPTILKECTLNLNFRRYLGRDPDLNQQYPK